MDDGDTRYSAVRTGNFQLVKRLANRLELDDPKLFYLCIENSYGESFDMALRRIEICKILLAKNKSLITGKSYNWDGDLHPGPLLETNVHLEILKFLVNEGANLEQVYARETVVHNAAWYMTAKDLHEFCCFLIDQGKPHLFQVNPEKWNSPVHHILFRGKDVWSKTIEMLLNVPGVSVKELETGSKNLITSAIYGQQSKSVLETLVRLGARGVSSVKTVESDILLQAAQQGHLDALLGITSSNTNILATTKYNHNVVHLASWNLPESKYRVFINSLKRHRHFERLLKTKEIGGRTPLHDRLRCFKGVSVETVELMLKHTEDISEKDVWGNNLFQSAVRGNKPKPVLELLVSHGAIYNRVNMGQQTPLHSAALAGNFDAVQYLLSLGIDKNAKDVRGATALTYARQTLKQTENDSKLQYKIEDARKVIEVLEEVDAKETMIEYTSGGLLTSSLMSDLVRLKHYQDYFYVMWRQGIDVRLHTAPINN